MVYSDIARRHMEDADGDGNGFLDAVEWLAYLNKDKPADRRDPKVDKQRSERKRGQQIANCICGRRGRRTHFAGTRGEPEIVPKRQYSHVPPT